MAVVARAAITAGGRAALSATLGIVAGLLVWAAASAVGLAALLSASATAFTVVKVAGAVYLVVLGLRTLLRARRAGQEPRDQEERAVPGALSFREGLVTNLLNPKIAVFYTTVLPQFVSPGDPALAVSLLLAAIHVTFSLAWLSAYGAAISRAGAALRRPRVRRVLDAVTGLVLVGLGARLAVAER